MELLSAFIPASTVRELSSEYGSLRQVLLNSHPEELQRLSGIGVMKAKQLQYLCELGKRLYQGKNEIPMIIRSPKDISERMADMRNLAVEEFRVVLLNTKNHVLAERVISKGIVNSAVVAPREVFYRAVKMLAVSIILVHNHPSGDCEPSSEDVDLTRKLVEAGKIMSIPVLDHVIIGGNHYCSLKEKGLIS